MRKISSKNSEKKKHLKNQRILGIILIIVMFGSVFGIVVNSLGSQNVEIEYNGFNFVNQNGLWNVQIGNLVFLFRYNPNQVKEIYSQVNFLNKYSNKPLYIYSESSLARLEITNNLGQISSSLENACFENCVEGEIVKTCEDNFIIIKEGSESSIRQQENCVFIEGTESELVKNTDEFLFKILGIRQ